MDTKHTPGPWSVSKSKHMGGEHVVATLAEDRDDRALVVHAPHGNADQDDANAYLIAAAPELLAALQRYVNCDKARDVSGDTPARQARAAIAKATGATHASE